MKDPLRISTTVTTEIELGVDQAAAWFCGLDDDQMARFFVAVAAIAKATYERDPDHQWYAVGGHLKSCKCSTEDAREMVRSLAHYMETSAHN